MSKRINIILIFIFTLWIFAGCTTTKIPGNYLPNPTEVKKSITGSWINVTLNSPAGNEVHPIYSGELIAIQSDTLYILSDIQLSTLKINDIESAVLYIFKNQGGKYALFTGILLAPNIVGTMVEGGIWASNFLALGIPMALTGSIITIIESSSKKNQLIYPTRNSIEEFRKFARFPMGIPPDLDKSELHLLKQKGK